MVSKSNYFPTHFPPMLLNPDATVSELIDVDTKWWSSPLLETLFSKDEIEKVRTIPLSCTNQEDILIWRGTKNEIFSVKSAYHLLKEMRNSEMASTLNAKVGHEIWKRLWALPVPNVEKNFLWRACHDILPTRANLHKRKVISNALCPVCGLEVETGFHILWQCSSAMDVWSMGHVVFQKSFFTRPEFRQVVEYMFERCTQEEL